MVPWTHAHAAIWASVEKVPALGKLLRVPRKAVLWTHTLVHTAPTMVHLGEGVQADFSDTPFCDGAAFYAEQLKNHHKTPKRF